MTEPTERRAPSKTNYAVSCARRAVPNRTQRPYCAARYKAQPGFRMSSNAGGSINTNSKNSPTHNASKANKTTLPTTAATMAVSSMMLPNDLSVAAPPQAPSAKRARSSPPASNHDDSDSGSDSTDGGDNEDAGNQGNTGRKEPSARMSLRKEKKSAREKARRQRENALFEELANMCNVPSDTRDKSSVLKAVIKRVEELKSRGGGGPGAASMLAGLQALSSQFGGTASSTSSVSSFGSLEHPKPVPAPVPAFLGPQSQAGMDDVYFANPARQWGTTPQQYAIMAAPSYPTGPQAQQGFVTGPQHQYQTPAMQAPGHFGFAPLLSAPQAAPQSATQAQLKPQGHFPPPPPNKAALLPQMGMIGSIYSQPQQHQMDPNANAQMFQRGPQQQQYNFTTQGNMKRNDSSE